MGWTVTPKDGAPTAEDKGEGKFEFTANTASNDYVYDVKYTDSDGCTTSTTFTVKACTCTCSDINITASNITINSAGTTSNRVQVGTCGVACCQYIGLETSPEATWLHLETGSTGEIYLYADVNSDAERTTTATLKMGSTACTTKTISVTQDSGIPPVTCSCDDLTVYAKWTPGYQVSSLQVGTYTSTCTCSVDSKPDWVSATINNGEITLTVTENDGDDREGDVTFSINDNVCSSKKITVFQYGQPEPEPCEEKKRLLVYRFNDFTGIPSDFTLYCGGGAGQEPIGATMFDNGLCMAGEEGYNFNVSVSPQSGNFLFHGSLFLSESPGLEVVSASTDTVEMYGMDSDASIRPTYPLIKNVIAPSRIYILASGNDYYLEKVDQEFFENNASIKYEAAGSPYGIQYEITIGSDRIDAIISLLK